MNQTYKMRGVLLFLILFAIMALASCNKEEVLEPPRETSNITFKLSDGVPDVVIKQTKTANITRYIVEVYKVSDPTILIKRVEQADATILVSLETNTNYVCLFWADGVAVNDNTTGTYNASNLKNVTLNAGKEMAEAFFGRLNIVDATTSFSVILKRPTAQVNIITTGTVTANTDLQISYKRYNSFNTYTSEVIGDEVYVSKTFNSTATIGTLGTFLTFASTVGVISNFTALYNSTTTNDLGHVPLKANYVTNIRGKYAIGYQVFAVVVILDEKWEDGFGGVAINVGTTESPKWIKVADRNAEKNGENGATSDNTATDYGYYYQWSSPDDDPTNAEKAHRACFDFGGGSGVWRLPTVNEWLTVMGNNGSFHTENANRKIKWENGLGWKLYDEQDGQTDKFVYFPLTGYRASFGPTASFNLGQVGSYRTSTLGSNSNTTETMYLITGGNGAILLDYNSYGLSVRCVKDL